MRHHCPSTTGCGDRMTEVEIIGWDSFGDGWIGAIPGRSNTWSVRAMASNTSSSANNDSSSSSSSSIGGDGEEPGGVVVGEGTLEAYHLAKRSRVCLVDGEYTFGTTANAAWSDDISWEVCGEAQGEGEDSARFVVSGEACTVTVQEQAVVEGIVPLNAEGDVCDLPLRSPCAEISKEVGYSPHIGFYYEEVCASDQSSSVNGCGGVDQDALIGLGLGLETAHSACRLCFINKNAWVEENPHYRVPDWVDCPCCVAGRLGLPCTPSDRGGNSTFIESNTVLIVGLGCMVGLGLVVSTVFLATIIHDKRELSKNSSASPETIVSMTIDKKGGGDGAVSDVKSCCSSEDMQHPACFSNPMFNPKGVCIDMVTDQKGSNQDQENSDRVVQYPHKKGQDYTYALGGLEEVGGIMSERNIYDEGDLPSMEDGEGVLGQMVVVSGGQHNPKKHRRFVLGSSSKTLPVSPPPPPPPSLEKHGGVRGRGLSSARGSGTRAATGQKGQNGRGWMRWLWSSHSLSPGTSQSRLRSGHRSSSRSECGSREGSMLNTEVSGQGAMSMSKQSSTHSTTGASTGSGIDSKARGEVYLRDGFVAKADSSRDGVDNSVDPIPHWRRSGHILQRNRGLKRTISTQGRAEESGCEGGDRREDRCLSQQSAVVVESYRRQGSMGSASGSGLGENGSPPSPTSSLRSSSSGGNMNWRMTAKSLLSLDGGNVGPRAASIGPRASSLGSTQSSASKSLSSGYSSGSFWSVSSGGSGGSGRSEGRLEMRGQSSERCSHSFAELSERRASISKHLSGSQTWDFDCKEEGELEERQRVAYPPNNQVRRGGKVDGSASESDATVVASGIEGGQDKDFQGSGNQGGRQQYIVGGSSQLGEGEKPQLPWVGMGSRRTEMDNACSKIPNPPDVLRSVPSSCDSCYEVKHGYSISNSVKAERGTPSSSGCSPRAPLSRDPSRTADVLYLRSKSLPQKDGPGAVVTCAKGLNTTVTTMTGRVSHARSQSSVSGLYGGPEAAVADALQFYGFREVTVSKEIVQGSINTPTIRRGQRDGERSGDHLHNGSGGDPEISVGDKFSQSRHSNTLQSSEKLVPQSTPNTVEQFEATEQSTEEKQQGRTSRMPQAIFRPQVIVNEVPRFPSSIATMVSADAITRSLPVEGEASTKRRVSQEDTTTVGLLNQDPLQMYGFQEVGQAGSEGCAGTHSGRGPRPVSGTSSNRRRQNIMTSRELLPTHTSAAAIEAAAAADDVIAAMAMASSQGMVETGGNPAGGINNYVGGSEGNASDGGNPATDHVVATVIRRGGGNRMSYPPRRRLGVPSGVGDNSSVHQGIQGGLSRGGQQMENPRSKRRGRRRRRRSSRSRSNSVRSIGSNLEPVVEEDTDYCDSSPTVSEPPLRVLAPWTGVDTAA